MLKSQKDEYTRESELASRILRQEQLTANDEYSMNTIDARKIHLQKMEVAMTNFINRIRQINERLKKEVSQ